MSVYAPWSRQMSIYKPGDTDLVVENGALVAASLWDSDRSPFAMLDHWEAE